MEKFFYFFALEFGFCTFHSTIICQNCRIECKCKMLKVQIQIWVQHLLLSNPIFFFKNGISSLTIQNLINKAFMTAKILKKLQKFSHSHSFCLKFFLIQIAFSKMMAKRKSTIFSATIKALNCPHSPSSKSLFIIITASQLRRFEARFKKKSGDTSEMTDDDLWPSAK